MAKVFNDLIALKKSYEEKLKKEGPDALKEAFKEVFDKHSLLKSIIWVQYTPYFMDGDPCYFSVKEFDISLVSSSSDGEDVNLTDDSYSYGGKLSSLSESINLEYKAIADSVLKLATSIPEDLLESVFGDHCEISATRDGFDVSEWEHD